MKFTKNVPVVMTPARQILSRMIAERDAIAGAANAIQAQMARLNSAAEGDPALESELRALNESEAQAMREWSINASDELPQPDTEKRAKINAGLDSARAKAAAAKTALAGMEGEYLRTVSRLSPLGDPIRAAVAEVLVDECEPLLRDYTAAAQALANQSAGILAVAMMLGDMARAITDPDGARPVFNIANDFAERVKKAREIPHADLDAASVARMSWAALASELSTDAAATLDR